MTQLFLLFVRAGTEFYDPGVDQIIDDYRAGGAQIHVFNNVSTADEMHGRVDMLFFEVTRFNHAWIISIMRSMTLNAQRIVFLNDAPDALVQVAREQFPGRKISMLDYKGGYFPKDIQ